MWNTISGTHAGDMVALWGFVAGQSAYHWAANPDAPGSTGATLQADIAGSGNYNQAQVTLAGLSLSDVSAHIAMATGCISGNPYLALIYR